jgi:hypothetical protein
VTNIETVTWTSATPTVVELAELVADAVSRISAAHQDEGWQVRRLVQFDAQGVGFC